MALRRKIDYACAMTVGSYEVERHIGADFFGGKIQQVGEIAKLNQYFMP